MRDVKIATVKIEHGAGELLVDARAPTDALMSGTFAGGVDQQESSSNGQLMLSLKPPAQLMAPWAFGDTERGYAWTVHLNRAVPINLQVHTGASRSQLDLSELNVSQIDLQTGASAVDLRLPMHAGNTHALIESGLAAVTITVPTGVGARIEGGVGLGAFHVDEARFPRRDGVYESDGFLTAENRVEIGIKSGLGEVTVR
jgi:N-terminal domain of toast_rack, DUF2154